MFDFVIPFLLYLAVLSSCLFFVVYWAARMAIRSELRDREEPVRSHEEAIDQQRRTDAAA